MAKITKIYAREVLDSSGNPTIEVDIHTNNSFGREIVSSGGSKGKYEAYELRDGGKRYLGMGVKKAVNNVNTLIAKKLNGLNITNQALIDETLCKLDGTKNKAKLGANAILGVSMACVTAASQSENIPIYEYIGRLAGNKRYVIPIPFMNIINGGVHAGNGLAFQEYLIIPIEKTFSESLRIGSEIYHMLEHTIEKKYGKNSTNLGDEGGFAPDLDRVIDPLDLIMETVEELGYQKKIYIGIDAAATQFYKKKRGKLAYVVDSRPYSFHELCDLYNEIIDEYPIGTLEDPFTEDRFDHFAEFMKKGKGVSIVGDDLTATNVDRIKKAISMKACNCLILKLNQVGTVTEAITAGKLAIKNSWDVIVSHRSGETENHFLSDFAVGLGFGQIKTGSPTRGERISKYNQLIRIEEKLGKKAIYPKKPCYYSCSIF